jgi:large subunit ribosomal protein L4e
MAKLKAKIFDLQGKVEGTIRLPKIFQTPVRTDVIKRAVLAIQSHRFQPQGRNPMAGKRTTAESRGVGLGIARIPRIKGGAGRGALAPGTVGGRAAHPPVSEKKIRKKIPKKERLLAIRSAIAATADKKLVAKRGHVIDEVPDLPLIVTDEFQRLKKSREVLEVLLQLGVMPDILRVKDSRKVRAGKGKRRGRRIKQAVGPLIVVNENEGVAEAARNLPGVDVVKVQNLNAELLAPGTHPGRLTIWTSSSIQRLNELFGAGEVKD